MKIAVIGVGLIGGSIGLALRGKIFHGKKIKVVGIGRKPVRLALAKKLGAVDEFTTDIKNGVRDADVIFIAAPVKTIPQIFQTILPYCKPGAIITDVGSTKSEISGQCGKILSRFKKKAKSYGPFFVGSHPIAGGEKTSVIHSKSDMFRGAATVITPLSSTTPASVIGTIKKLWSATGSKVYILKPAEHDSILARTSHLPHIAAYALVNSIIPSKDKNFTGPGWRDTTRIASSDPFMWAEIITSNKAAIRRELARFKKNLSAIEKVLSDDKSLAKILSRARDIRDSIHQASTAK